MNISEIKAALPKYIWLQAEKDIWQEGDECLPEKIDAWHPVTRPLIGTLVMVLCARRPIPDEVLENQAFWVLYNRLATVAPDVEHFFLNYHSIIKCVTPHEAKGRVEITGKRGFTSKEAVMSAVETLGGIKIIRKHLSAGDLYSKWIGEQIGASNSQERK